MGTRFCINPKDPTYRYIMTEFLEAAGFIECPAPGIPIPTTLLTGAGGVLDQTAAALATLLRKKMGENPTEDQLKILSKMINGADLKTLEKDDFLNKFEQTPSPAVINIKPAGAGAFGAMNEPDPPLIETRVVDPITGETTILEPKTLTLREMTSIPLVEVTETADSFCERTFNGAIKSVDKTAILNYGLKRKQVTLDMSKTKPQLIKDLQMLEIFDAAKG